MFSFHKPKIYRSVHGCCICRAKSSSSRFTDSKKYEADFEKCFRIIEIRAGEICNACVLLVKRWKKLPVGTNRHWHHVVDARAGPGTKSTLKLKSRLPLKHKHRSLKKKKRIIDVHVDRIPSPQQVPADLSAFEDSLDRTDAFSYSQSSTHSHDSPSISEDDSDNEDSRDIPQHKHSQRKSFKRGPKLHISSFLDLTYWKKTEVCCGIIFKGPNGEVLVDPQLLNPCRACRQGKLSGPTPMKRSQSTDTESNSNQSYPGPDDVDLDVDPDEDDVETPARSVPSAFSLPPLQCGAQQMGSLQQRVISMEC